MGGRKFSIEIIDEIDNLNDLCFQLALEMPNFWLFNNLFFNEHTHLAYDDLHLTTFGKWSASTVWIEAVMRILGYRTGSLPLRPRYTDWLQYRRSRSYPGSAGAR